VSETDLGAQHRPTNPTFLSLSGRTRAPRTRHRFSAFGSRNGSETARATAENAKPEENPLTASCCGQHSQFSCFACRYLTTNSRPKISPLFVVFVSATLTLDPKTRNNTQSLLLLSSNLESASNSRFDRSMGCIPLPGMVGCGATI
jgi:hypothetical protein